MYYCKIFISCYLQPIVVRYGVGASLSWAFQLELEQITAVAIETSFQVSLTSASNTFNLSFQNGSIAFILLKMSFEEPLGELAAVAPVAQVRKYLNIVSLLSYSLSIAVQFHFQLMITGLPLWLVLAVLKTYQRYIACVQEL